MSLRSRKAKERRSMMRTLRKQQAGRCYICGHSMNFKERNHASSATFDHLVPYIAKESRPDRLVNLKLAHQSCNQKRGAITALIYAPWAQRQLT